MEQTNQPVNPQGESIPPFTLAVSTVSKVPLIRHSDFADQLGVTTDVVRGWVNSRKLPTIKIGKYSFINLARLHADLLAGGLAEVY